jgi:thioesterase domain-containing protein
MNFRDKLTGLSPAKRQLLLRRARRQTAIQSHAVRTDHSLVTIQAGEGSQPFFCVHPAAGQVSCYTALARGLGAKQTFYGLQALGTEENQQIQVEAMASHYLAEVRVAQPSGPYMLGGWSMGGLVAFEMAQQLHAMGEDVSFLALIDCRAPAFAKDREEDESVLLLSFAQSLGISLPALPRDRGFMATLTADEQLSYILEKGRETGGLAPGVEIDWLRHLFKVFKANVYAARSYRPRFYQGKVTLFKCAGPDPDPVTASTLGWGSLARFPVEVHRVSGSHYTMIDEPHVKSLAAALSSCIAAIAK